MRFGLIGGDARYLARFRKQLLLAIRDRGHEVHAFAGAPVADVEDELNRDGITVHSFPLERRGVSPLGEVPTMASLARALTEVRPDIVLSYTPNPINDLFILSISIDIGNNQDNRIGIATRLIDKSGTATYGPEDLKKEWYKLQVYILTVNLNNQHSFHSPISTAIQNDTTTECHLI